MFATGGPVQAFGADALYLERSPVDDLLFQLCRRGACATLLGPRQIGKTSSMVHVMGRLIDAGTPCVLYDLQGKSISTASQLFSDLFFDMVRQLRLEDSLEAWWREHQELHLPQRFATMIRELLVPRFRSPLVLLIDEIDSLCDPIRKEFFAAISAVPDPSASSGTVSVVLAGMASATLLAKSGFGITNNLELLDFTPEQLTPVESALDLDENTAREVRDRVFWWTGGHPYLTMRVLADMAETNCRTWRQEEIDAIVEQRFTKGAVHDDPNISFVQGQIVNFSRQPDLQLRLYSKILGGQRAVLEESDAMRELMLCGLVKSAAGEVSVRNRIYARVLNEEWIDEAREATSHRQRRQVP